MPTFQGHVLEIKHFRMRYPGSMHWILDGLNFTIASGDRVALVGPSGCGKSTIARAILQLLPSGSVCQGQLLLTGQDTSLINPSTLRRLRGEAVGLVFQDPMTRLNPLMTLGGHLVDTLKAHLPEKNRQWYRNRAEELLEKVGISSERFSAYPHELSGGMRQRLAIALAIALNPPLIIADEPTTSLDVSVADQVMNELSSLCEDLGTALLLISHDLALAARWCERMAVIENGKIVEDRPSRELLMQPKSLVGMRLVKAARSLNETFLPLIKQQELVLEINRLRCWHSINEVPWRMRWIKAVDEISFSIRRGETLGIVGISGCGKTTLCRALMGLVPLRGGEVKLHGENILRLRGKSLKEARQSMQMVFQDPLACLNPKMTIGESVSDPLLVHKLASRLEASQKTRELLEQVGLSPAEHYQNRLPSELSGGQLQRVAIARALSLKPTVLICDESVSMLDAEIQYEILFLLRSLQEKLGLSILFITHDLVIASSFCDNIIVLEHGKIAERASGDKLLSDPKALITRKLVEASCRLPLRFDAMIFDAK